jgi:hypothetical protein
MFMGDQRDHLLRRVIESYHSGRSHLVQVAPASAGYLFTDLLEQTIQQLWPHNECTEFGEALCHIREGLRAARAGQFVSAGKNFTRVRQRLSAGTGSKARILLEQSSLAAAEGYLEYRLGDWSKARRCVLEALEIDCELECFYGFDILHIHRIQLLQNLIRVDARRGCDEQAIDLAGHIFQYFDESVDTLPIGTNWDHSRMASIPIALSLAMEAEIGCEIVRLLAGRDAYRSLRLFQRATFPAHPDGTKRQPRLIAWAMTKEAFLTGKTDVFLELCAGFLPTGREDTPLFWYATVIDLIATCKSLNTELSLSFCEHVVADATAWEDLPPDFMRLLKTSLCTIADYSMR